MYRFAATSHLKESARLSAVNLMSLKLNREWRSKFSRRLKPPPPSSPPPPPPLQPFAPLKSPKVARCVPNHSLKFYSDANYPKRRSEELRRLKKSVGRGEESLPGNLCTLVHHLSIHPSIHRHRHYSRTQQYLFLSLSSMNRSIESFYLAIVPFESGSADRLSERRKVSSNCPFGGGCCVAEQTNSGEGRTPYCNL